MTKFYDTCSLILDVNHLFEDEGLFKTAISSVTLMELERIKSKETDLSKLKDVRKLIRILEANRDKYDVVIFTENMINEFIYHWEKPTNEQIRIPINDDIKILATALYYDKTCDPDETYFVTNDLSLKNIANLFFGEDCIISVKDRKDSYTGYVELYPTERELADLYTNMEVNSFGLLPNQYLILKDKDNNILDKLCWTGTEHRSLTFGNFDSMWFKIKPMKNDPYQALLADSLINNKITMVKGPAGSGKTTLSLGFLMHELEKHRIERVVIFCNTVATMNSAKLGYYPGTRDEKMMDSQIGNLLASKFGDRSAVQQLIDQNKLVILPMSDIRGYDTSGIPTGIYISEAQNLDISLMKLALQRIGEDGICIIDGDDKTQVDDIAFAGSNSGMKRVSEVFRGEDIYGEIELKICHRSKVAQIAERM